MKVTFIPEEGAPSTTSQFGYDFTAGKATDVTDEKALAKFSGNPFFKVSEGKAEKPTEDGLKAVHNGGGRFVIKNGDEVVKTGLTKEDADAFNQLSPEDQEAYIS